MFIKRFSIFLNRIVHTCIQSSKRKKFGYQKMQNFTLISNPLKKFFKNAKKNVTEICTFSPFTHVRVRQTCFAYNFFSAFLKNFFNGFEISMKFCVFDTFFGHISTFFKF